LRLAILRAHLDDPLDLPRDVRGRVLERPKRLGLALAPSPVTSTSVKPKSAICRATMSFLASDSSKPSEISAVALVHGEFHSYDRRVIST
jgi:hypothetical protein